jgi:hypothetical protein
MTDEVAQLRYYAYLDNGFASPIPVGSRGVIILSDRINGCQ